MNAIYNRGGCSLQGRLDAFVGTEMASLLQEVKALKEENKRLEEAVAAAAGGDSKSKGGRSKARRR